MGLLVFYSLIHKKSSLVSHICCKYSTLLFDFCLYSCSFVHQKMLIFIEINISIFSLCVWCFKGHFNPIISFKMIFFKKAFMLSSGIFVVYFKNV